MNEDKILMLQKPRRGWWVAPGGKMEPGESVKESVKREYREETGLMIQNPEIKGIFTIVMIEDDKIVSEWMMFTFVARDYEGNLLEQSPEGDLEWKNIDDVLGLRMAEGDKFIFKHIIDSKEPLLGTFHYTPDFKLLSYRLEPNVG